MKKGLVITMVVIASVALTAGIVKAASYNITSALGGVSGDFFDVDGTMIFDSIKVGAQGVGGVTFFNGTIVNNTTGEGDADNPVTFGDNVRIDGRVYRGATAGTTDTLPFIVNDNMEVVGTLTVAGLSGTGIVSSDNIADGVVVAADLASGSVTSAKIFDGTVTDADVNDSAAINTAKINGLDDTLTSLDNNKADVNHNHDSSYVSKSSPEWDARTGYITVPAAAFTPWTLTLYNYTNEGNILYDSKAGTSNFVAPVFLPHGATVTQLDFYYKDNSANSLTLSLDVTAMMGSGTSMASISSSGLSGQYTSSSTTTINVSTVDNLSSSYFLHLQFPSNDGSNLVYSGAVIHYSYSEPY